MFFRSCGILLLIGIGISCNEALEKSPERAKSDFVTTDLFASQPDVLLLSCVRCSCFTNDLMAAYREDSMFFKKIYMVSDSSCGIGQLFEYSIQQSQLDQLNEDFFNIILLRKTGKGNEYKYRIIQTKESRNLLGIAKTFFRH